MKQITKARIVVMSRACLTAITPAIKLHIRATKEISPPRKGMKEKNLIIPGEYEKPMVRSNSPYVACVSDPFNIVVPRI